MSTRTPPKKKPYPQEEGWLRATLTMNTNELADKAEIKAFLSNGNADAYEWAEFSQNGKKVKVIFRRKPAQPAA